MQFSITILQEPIDANDATRLKLASARKLFLQVREEAYRRTVASYEAFFEGRVDKAGVRALATLMMAAADGLFIAHEIDRDDVNFEAAFGLLAAALLGASEHLRARIHRSRNENLKTGQPHGLGPATNDMDRQASLQKH